jgi:hypothetical protein
LNYRLSIASPAPVRHPPLSFAAMWPHHWGESSRPHPKKPCRVAKPLWETNSNGGLVARHKLIRKVNVTADDVERIIDYPDLKQFGWFAEDESDNPPA